MAVATTGLALAQEINLDKIIVTPSRNAQTIAQTSSSVSVIDSEDIGYSNAGTVTDVLRPVPGLIIRDYYGNASKVSVDTRGFGEMGQLNTLVLVDGRRVNEVDQSGVDWTQVPLSQVERIEIIRGGSGGVLYGDNAVGGVINIITKKGRGKPKIEFEASVGSFDYNKQNLSLNGSTKSLSYFLSASHAGTNGYRNNGFYKGSDFGSKFTYDLSPKLAFRFSNGYHDSSYGIPGPLTPLNMQQFGRRYSQYGDDHAHDKDFYFDLGGETKALPIGNFDLGMSYRRKEVNTLFLSSINYAGGNPVYKNTIDTYGFTPKYTLEKNLFHLKNKFTTGADFYRSQYISDNHSRSDILQNYAHINKTSAGLYLQDEFTVLKNLTVSGGWRWEQARYTFNYHDFSGMNADIDSKLTPDKKAFSVGATYNYMAESSLFINLNQNYRFPATDEYYSVWGVPPVNINLKPQASENIEFGIRHAFNKDLKFDFSFFRMNVENELYYNPLTYANENYDKTRHQGAELSFDSRLYKKIGLFGNYSYTKSTFRGGVYDKKMVPMVPEHKASFGLRFSLPKNITLNIQGSYVGKRYTINDQANNFTRLPGYFTTDTNFSYAINDFTLTGAVNNIFDRMYSEYAVCNSTSGAKNYYPSPGRSFSIKAGYKF